MDFSFSDINFNSVENVPGYEARAAFTVNSSSVFKEDTDIVPTIVDDTLSYIPWGGDNQMPFDILNLIEKDETLATCQIFNAEVCYGSGLRYDTCIATAKVRNEVEDFFLDNDLAAYFLGVSQHFKHFGFAVSMLILNEEGTKIVRLLRKEACYCRFAPADAKGRISKILYANWRKPISPWLDLQDKLAKNTRCRKFAIVSRIPTVDSTYYPIPYRAIQREVVQHQAAYRYCQGSEATQYRAYQVSYRSGREILGTAVPRKSLTHGVIRLISIQIYAGFVRGAFMKCVLRYLCGCSKMPYEYSNSLCFQSIDVPPAKGYFRQAREKIWRKCLCERIYLLEAPARHDMGAPDFAAQPA